MSLGLAEKGKEKHREGKSDSVHEQIQRFIKQDYLDECKGICWCNIALELKAKLLRRNQMGAT